MASRKGPELRAHQRTKKRIGVNIVYYNGRKTLPKLDEEVGLNIALGGMLIECSKRLIKNASLKLMIMLAFDSQYEILRIPAKVMWNRKSFRKTYFIGCKFLRLAPKDRKILVRFLKNSSV